MGRFVVGTDRDQATMFPPCLEDWIAEDNPVRVIDVFVDTLDLGSLGFEGVEAAATGRPGYHPPALLKLYVYGYLNRIPSIRRLEREASRNVEVMWLTGRLSPDHKTIAEFRRQNGRAIGRVCARFVALCREMRVRRETVEHPFGTRKARMGATHFLSRTLARARRFDTAWVETGQSPYRHLCSPLCSMPSRPDIPDVPDNR